eukprot:3014408-Lingulodinium_polyedra.AAC.1
MPASLWDGYSGHAALPASGTRGSSLGSSSPSHSSCRSGACALAGGAGMAAAAAAADELLFPAIN